ncbi:TlpA family protein disulfide reductase, partial [Aliarcobacter butzleri]
MKFKTLAFLSILTILFFTGCDSKDNSQNKAQTQQADRVTEFQLETADNQTINITLLNDKILFKDYP